jgi:hypothetical protein
LEKLLVFISKVKGSKGTLGAFSLLSPVYIFSVSCGL